MSKRPICRSCKANRAQGYPHETGCPNKAQAVKNGAK